MLMEPEEVKLTLFLLKAEGLHWECWIVANVDPVHVCFAPAFHDLTLFEFDCMCENEFAIDHPLLQCSMIPTTPKARSLQ